MFYAYALGAVALLALGFGLGRLRHPANLKLANVKAELGWMEKEIEGLEARSMAYMMRAISRLKALL